MIVLAVRWGVVLSKLQRVEGKEKKEKREN